jgi:CO/xanthine dehydrogenase Mo-binding subunit
MITSRRDFIIAGMSAGGALVLDIALPERVAAAELGQPFAPNAWLSIARDDAVTLTLAKSEMGQGVWTALPLLIAEELEVDWARVQVRQADARPRNSYQDTGGSTSVADSWELLRRAGGAARVMLINAAATMWQVPASECVARNGRIVHKPSAREAPYGSLCERASALPVPDPATVALKQPGEFRLIGSRVAQLDAPAKITGQARYGVDVRVPGMLYASVERCPYFAGRLLSHDPAAALAVKGVKQVVPLDPVGPPIHLPARVAVLATSTWAALQGRRALKIEWDRGPHTEISSAQIAKGFADKLAGPAKVIIDENDPAARFEGERTLEASYETPFLAHQAMEPINCTAHVTSAGIEIWAPTQFPSYAQGHVSHLTGVPLEQIQLHVTFVGGGFGRRINADFIIEAVQTSRAAGAPVQVLWTREDDTRGDFYRPAGLQHVRAALRRNPVEAGGTSLVWDHRIVGPSTNSFYEPGHPNPEEQELWGATELPYRMSARRLEYVEANTPVPIGWWRSVGYSQNIFAIESAINELADLADADHVALRRELSSEHPRLQAVLDLAARQAEWPTRPRKGRGRGVAACKYDNTYVAQVIDVSVSARGKVSIERVVCAIDCGLVVNPSGLEAQVEGSIVWGLSAALMSEITVANGGIVQGNFNDAPVLRLSETPRIEVHVIRTTDPPTGAGEPAVAPVAPALVDAIHAATGKRLRRLPVQASLATRARRS